jgi:hypothetical protein
MITLISPLSLACKSSPNHLLAKGLRRLQTAARSNYLKSSDLPARPRLSLPSTRQKLTGTVSGHVPHHLMVHQVLGTDEGKHQSPRATHATPRSVGSVLAIL